MPDRARARRASSRSLASGIGVAVGAVVVFLLVLGLMLFKADLLARYGLLGRFYFLVLVFLGLSAGAFLFGVLDSYATWTGQVVGGTLKAGGPVVVVLLVVGLGTQVEKPPHELPLTVIVHGEGGRQDLPLKGKGNILLTIAGDQRRMPIGLEGQVVFPSISSAVLARPIPVSLEAEGYEVATTDATLQVDGQTAWLPVKARSAAFSGYVRTTEGNPVPAATVSAAGVRTATDPSGYFRLAVPGAGPGGGITLQVTAAGYRPWNQLVHPGGNEIGVALSPVP